MAKAGMKRYVSNHKDPTYEAVLHNVRQEAKEKRRNGRRQVRKGSGAYAASGNTSEKTGSSWLIIL